MSENNAQFDCVVVGAGPAGLTALTYLARFHRKAIALGGEGPRPRCTLIDRSYNLPGFAEGVNGVHLIHRLREQSEEFGGEIWTQTATRISGSGRNFKIELSDNSSITSQKVILAMGVHDRTPDVPGIKEHEGHFLRYCPVCDGYEHTGKKLGIIGSGTSVARHALFLQTFSNDVTIFLHGQSAESLGNYRETLERHGIAWLEPRIVKVLTDDDPAREYRGSGVCLDDGSAHNLDALYSALGCELHLKCVEELSLKLDEDGYIVTDINMETSVPGLYAAGDLTSQINQISVAFGQAAIAAVRVHNALDV
jgi:thioredoxin reductase (NADPH)